MPSLHNITTDCKRIDRSYSEFRSISSILVPHFTVVADRQRADVRRPLIDAGNPEGTTEAAQFSLPSNISVS
jgi:hypothetical protein